jgi:hypothetical protein
VYWNNDSVITLIPVGLNGADVNSSPTPETDMYLGVWAVTRFEHFLTALSVDRILRHLSKDHHYYK